jgi:16S rRNA processing protein RimM
MQKYLECGIITNTHGINGALKVLSQCDSPDVLAELEYVYIEQLGVYRELEVTSATVYKDTVIFTFDGIDTVDKAARLKGKTLFADREDFILEDGEYFLADIIGLDVIDANTGKTYGKVENVNTNSAQMLYEVKTEKGIRLLPAVDAFIKEVVLDKAIYVTPVAGLLDDEDEV